MRNFKIMLALLWHQLQACVYRKRCLAGYLLGMASVIVTSMNYYKFLGNHSGNVWEAFIEHFGTLGSTSLIVFGFILVISDAPFIYTDSFLKIHRTGRKNWYHAMWMYLAAQCFLYYFLMALVSAVILIKKTYLNNIWSTVLQSYSQNFQTFRYGLAPPAQALFDYYTPWSALFHTFLLIVLYSIFLAGLIFALNMYAHTALGTIAAGGLHLATILFSSLEKFSFLWPWLYLDNALLGNHLGENGLTLMHSYLYFLLSIFIVYLLGKYVAVKTDFCMLGSSGEDE